MIRYDIEGGQLPVVICYPEAGQTLCTESGAMSWMSPNMHMETNSGGGFRKVLGRLFSGESLFVNEYTAVGGTGMIAFASSFPGSIIPYTVTPGNGIIVQKRGFLAMEKGLDLSVYSVQDYLVEKDLLCRKSAVTAWFSWRLTATARNTNWVQASR